MLSTPLTCCSMGVATACSRAFASAPTYVACSLISGGTMFGNCATGSPAMVTAPTITIRMAITIATIGRLMKNFDIAQFPSAARMCGFGCNEGSVPEFLQSVDYNLLTRLEAFVNNPHRPDRLPGLHGAHTNFAIAADHCYLITSLRLRDCALGR